ncbi:spore coat protein GerQ [Guptibacillus hwajinpoensis]|uniref:Spore germination protein Q n=2 Tax=Guptibacillus hwajinpoensis TaxID=208199 RepID=A0ABU0JYT2_9BACL|nr:MULTISPECIES: spore coat protein GerQ [Alkalihalobacillus]MDP4551493.1 spore coat protein GerQ [Alkalihalobacillus macyae]MDQ0482269.1 spore germination protein Q [Alkalihalobacillus hemicentroti]
MMNNQYWNKPAAQNQGGGYQQMSPQQGQGGQMGQYPSGYPGQGQQGQVQGAMTQGGSQGFPGQLPVEQSYIENILRLNLGKVATVYMTFENNEKWNAKVFKGVVEAAGRDHIILSDPQTGKRYLLLMVYLDYITFDEELEYNYPLQQVTQYSPR